MLDERCDRAAATVLRDSDPEDDKSSMRSAQPVLGTNAAKMDKRLSNPASVM